jgi:hypothetical protein
MEVLFKPHKQQVEAEARRVAVRETVLGLLQDNKQTSLTAVHAALPLKISYNNCAILLRALVNNGVIRRVPGYSGWYQMPLPVKVIAPRLYQSEFIRAANPSRAVAGR